MSPINLALSCLPDIRQYLSDRAIDLTALIEDVAAKTQRIHELENAQCAAEETDKADRAAYDASKLAYKDAEDAYELRKAFLQEAVWTVEVEMRRKHWPWNVACLELELLVSEPTSPDYDPVAAECWGRVEEARRALESLERFRGPDILSYPQSRVAAIGHDLRCARHDLQTTEVALQELRTQKEGATLPEGWEGLTDEVVSKLSDIDFESLDFEPQPEVETDAAYAAYIRSELPIACTCNKGFVTIDVDVEGHVFRVELDDMPRHQICRLRALFHPASIAGVIPTKHAHHRMYNMQPWPGSPMSADKQQKAIARVPSYLVDDLHGWLMLGPAGCSKTTYAAAAVYDWLTFRVSEETDRWDYISAEPEDCFHEPLSERLNYWRVKVPKWTRETEAWETRAFDDELIEEPYLTTDRLEKVTRDTGLRPILVLEELDKFAPTKNRLRFLYTLVDAVYEAGGCIVSTSNETPAGLREMIGEPLYRRLSGCNDAPEEYMVFDMHRAGKTEAKRKTSPRA